ncbi:hemolysin family protein [Paenibacillus pasadenensis]|uniref:hemolysin family protein n=1 Tax=Paenibacillus pasadenensis TaxID=217090 RepID=UPI00203FE1D7|nr:hemolysin family protein [Paenibacillus pasadenensis]MCM3745745.1 hemolysin family protein [Paenibacillus pasadenensis]
MDGMIVLNLLLVALFIGLTAFFVGAEFAILKVRMSRLDQLIAEGNKKAVKAKKVAQNLDYYLSACQLGITITALVLGALGEPTVERMLHPLFTRMEVPETLSTVLSYAIALSIITFLHVVIGELAPKTLAIQFSEKMTLLLAPPLYGFGKAMNPVIFVLNHSARILLRLFGVKPSGHETVYSEEELKLIVDQSYKSGEINQTELEYLKNIFDFEDRILKEIMIPKAKMVTIEANLPVSLVLERLERHSFTRYPVADGQQLIGYINSKELLTGIAAGRNRSLQEMTHPMPSFKETSSIRDVLIEMQRIRVHMAIVTTDIGVPCGLVTMEDILEEIVGDIRDEAVIAPKPVWQ